ncbi:M20 family metallopeptidase [Nanoarchaeota archaeon]
MNIKGYTDNKREEYINILSDLIRQDTTNPPGNEYLAATIIHKKLQQLNIPFTTHEKEKGRTNTIAKIGSKGKQVLFSAHLDVVPADDGWDTPPFEPIIKNGEMYGRGTTDNKAQCACILLIAEYLKSIEQELKNTFIFVWAADEEQGSKYGIDFLLKEKLISPNMAIIPDVGGNLEKIDIAEKGITNIQITAIGKAAHGAYPHLGTNAIIKMAKFLTKISNHELDHKSHKYLSAPTINIGTITGGSVPNSVPDSCSSVLNIRYLPSQKPESIIEELKTVAGKDFKFKILLDIPATEMEENHILIDTIIKIAKTHNIHVRRNGLSGGTDTKRFLLNNIPAVGYDFVADNLAHSANEHVTLNNLFKYAIIMCEVCQELDNSI